MVVAGVVVALLLILVVKVFGEFSRPAPDVSRSSAPTPASSGVPSPSSSLSPSSAGVPSPSMSVPRSRGPVVPGSPADDGLTDVAGSTSRIRLTATASVALQPGLPVPLDVSFTNLGSRAVRVTHVAISIASVTTPNVTRNYGCPASGFVLTQIDPSFVVELPNLSTQTLSSTNTSTALWPTLELVALNTNQDGCKGATVDLTYTAQGNNP